MPYSLDFGSLHVYRIQYDSMLRDILVPVLFALAGQFRTVNSSHWNLILATFKIECEQPDEKKKNLISAINPN